MYAQPSEGETEDNESPRDEAAAKVQWLWNNEYQDRDVIIIATDTVERSTATGESLGKPMYLPDFPEADADPEQLTAFFQAYKEKYYPKGSATENVNGIAILRTSVGRIETFERVLSQRVDHLKLQLVTLCEDMAGSGISQQLIKWVEEEAAAILKEIGDETIKEHLKDKSNAYILWSLYCQITGMPWWAIEDGIESYINSNESGDII